MVVNWFVWIRRGMLAITSASSTRKPRRFYRRHVRALSYRELDVDGRQFIFRPRRRHNSSRKKCGLRYSVWLALQPRPAYLTHYSQVPNVHAQGQNCCAIWMHWLIWRCGKQAAGRSAMTRIKQKMTEYLLAEIRQHGCQLAESTLLDIWATDLELNAQGLGVWPG